MAYLDRISRAPGREGDDGAKPPVCTHLSIPGAGVTTLPRGIILSSLRECHHTCLDYSRASRASCFTAASDAGEDAVLTGVVYE